MQTLTSFFLNTIKTKLIFLFYYAFGHIYLYRIPNFSFGVFQPRIWLCQKARILVTKRGRGCLSPAVPLGLTSGPEQQRGPPAHQIRESFSIFRWESTKPSVSLILPHIKEEQQVNLTCQTTPQSNIRRHWLERKLSTWL